MIKTASSEEKHSQHQNSSEAAAVLPKLWQRTICFEHAHKDSHVTTKFVESAAQITLASCTSSESTIIEAKEWIALESMVSRCGELMYS